MAFIQSSISPDYRPHWKRWEIIREVIQNALDARDMYGCELDVSWYDAKKGGRLRITTTGQTMSLASGHILGKTDKIGHAAARGYRAEGFKVAAAISKREGLSIVVRTGRERWEGKVKFDRRLGVDVFGWDTRETTYFDGVQVDVYGIGQDEWEAIRQRFLDLEPPREVVRKDGYYGAIILDPAFKGLIFSKGIFVCKDDSLGYGYDFGRCVELDIDRNVPRSWDLEYAIGALQAHASATRPDLFDVLTTLEAGGKESKQLAHHLSEEQKQGVIDRFEDRHGKGAVAVESTGQAIKAEHVGVKAVVVPGPVLEVIRSVKGDPAAQIQERVKADAGIVQLHDLEDEERQNLVQALETLALAGPFDLDRVSVVVFGDPAVLGMWRPEGRKVQLSRAILGDFEQTIATLIHEFAHDHGSDGDVSHERAVEKINARIIARLLGR